MSLVSRNMCAEPPFAAELVAAVDAADMLMMLNGALRKLQHGVQTTERARQMRETEGYSLP
eukprot:8453006-Lingulodinium_polyedra.AAC.1